MLPLGYLIHLCGYFSVYNPVMIEWYLFHPQLFASSSSCFFFLACVLSFCLMKLLAYVNGPCLVTWLIFHEVNIVFRSFIYSFLFHFSLSRLHLPIWNLYICQFSREILMRMVNANVSAALITQFSNKLFLDDFQI